ncbi:MAG: hypothetical protein ABSC06_33120 [Rhodopila sp.]
MFPTLSVRQNLELGWKRAGRFGRWSFEDVFRLFPNPAARQGNPAGVLSGGEQQMLTMCRIRQEWRCSEFWLKGWRQYDM